VLIKGAMDQFILSSKRSLVFSGVPRNFFRGGGGVEIKQIRLRTEDRENGDLGAVAP
jgi:hypothetical protein